MNPTVDKALVEKRVAAGVFGRLFDLGGSRPQRFWCSFGARLARYSGGCKDVSKLADDMLALAASPVHARRSRKPVRPTVLQSMLQRDKVLRPSVLPGGRFVSTY